MNRICLFEPPLILAFATRRGKLLRVIAIHLAELTRHCIARGEVHLFGDRLEKPPPNDLESLLDAGRRPWRLKTSEGVLDPRQRLVTRRTTLFDVGGRQTCHYHRLGGC